MAMDINKEDSICNSSMRIGMEIGSNFADHFSDSTSSQGDTAKITNNNNVSRSPCKEQNTYNCPKIETYSRDEAIDSVNGLSPTSKLPQSKQLKAQSKQSMNNFCSTLSSSVTRDEKGIKNENKPLSPQIVASMGISSVSDNENNSGCNKNTTLSPLPTKNIGTISKSACNELNVGPKIETEHRVPIENNVSPNNQSETGFSSNNLKASTNFSSLNGHVVKCSSSAVHAGDGGKSLNALTTGSNSNEYMQQNHVFVFSTQLANKSADAVLCGQFPTIIAYHCMQPTTKLFLEDFLKNPSKTTKLQRQYSLNIINSMQSGTDGSQLPIWSNENENRNINGFRFPLRSSVNKKNGDYKSTSFIENHQICPDFPALETTLNGPESGEQINDISSTPSLQGVKVPDENLTPQQRQHREEQLAKLKKMNKFLFPENDMEDFQGPSQQANNISSVTSDADSKASGSSGGICSDGLSIKMGQPTMRKKSGKKNIKTESAMSLSANTLPVDGKVSMSNIDLIQNIQDVVNVTQMNLSVNTLKSRQCDMDNNQSIANFENSQINNPGASFAVNANTLSDVETNDSTLPSMSLSQKDWRKFQSNSFQNNFSCESQQKVNNQAVLSPVTYSCEQNMSSISTMGTNTINRNNNGPPPPYQQTSFCHSAPLVTESSANANTDKSSTDTHPTTQKGPSRLTNSGISKSTMPNLNNNTANNLPQIKSHNTSVLNNVATNSAVSASNVPPREFNGQNPQMNSPHKFENTSGGMLNDFSVLDAKYNNFGMHFPQQNMRPNRLQQMPSHFGRRIDNIPLNPNLTRVDQNKSNITFDPISSLTQMSQQLTGVGLGTMGSGGISSSGLGSMDINHGISNTSLDQCNQLSNSNRVLMGATTDLNGILCGDINVPMDQRFINGKVCPPTNFTQNSALTGVGLRESAVGYNNMTPMNRPLIRRRMTGNFDNFNVSSNIHIKASAPNTIQYMPARSQNLSNIRVPPSADVFQRYSNSQAMTNIGVDLGQPSGATSNNNMSNPNAINIFENLNLDSNRGFEQNNLGNGNVLSNNEYMNVPR